MAYPASIHSTRPIASILQAYTRIKNSISKTPVITNDTLNQITGKNVYIKCENLQKTGSFKARGALNGILAKIQNSLISKNGCVAYSSGNHGLALAWASKSVNIDCKIVLTKGTPESKLDGIKAYGGKVHLCDVSHTARLEACNQISKSESKTIISPHDDYDVLYGGATIALEFLNQVPNLDAILVPVGGGGMISAISLCVKSIKPSIKVFAVEAQGKNLEQSLKNGRQNWPNEPMFIKTKAEGIRMLQCTDLTYSIFSNLIEKNVFTQSDESMIDATKFVFERLKLVVELSSGASIAAVLSEKMKTEFPDLRNIGIILCGGNINVDHLPWNK